MQILSLPALFIGRWALNVGRWAFPILPMFPLKTATFPSNAADLAQALNKSLRDLFAFTGDPV